MQQNYRGDFSRVNCFNASVSSIVKIQVFWSKSRKIIFSIRNFLNFNTKNGFPTSHKNRFENYFFTTHIIFGEQILLVANSTWGFQVEIPTTKIFTFFDKSDLVSKNISLYWLSLLTFLNLCTIKSLTSEATHSATPFFKRAYKISHHPGL